MIITLGAGSVSSAGAMILQALSEGEGGNDA